MLLQLLRPALSPLTSRLALLLLLQLAQTAALLYLPALNADIIDEGVVRGELDRILSLGGIMLALTVLQAVCTVGAVRLASRVATAVSRDIRASVFRHVQTFSGSEFTRFGTSSLISRTTNDVQQVEAFLLSGLILLVEAPLICLVGIVVALRQDVALSSVLLVIIPGLVLLMGLVLRRTRPVALQLQENTDTVNRVLREQIAGTRVVRAFVREEHETQRFERASRALADVSVTNGRLGTLLLPLGATVVNLFTVPMVWLGANRIDAGHMEVGDMVAFLTYMALVLASLMTLASVLMMLPRAQVCARRISEVLRVESAVTPPARPVRRMRRPGHVELRGVGFSYPGAEAPVVRDVTLSIRPGESVALVGPTGSGKSTLLQLMLRIVDATEGQILMGGEDIRSLDPTLLTRRVGYVPQRPYLFSGTVASNLRLGRPDASDGELWRALATAQAQEFVGAMEESLGARIAQGGTNVSGGQRQRLAMARALLVRPDIYLFDDAFSSLDYLTEAALRTELAHETSSATVVFVAQRVSTIKSANRIVVLDQGRVVGDGTHEELFHSNVIYRDIVLAQPAEEGPS
ncbi:ABC transporter ATP-binding protein [Streptomyces sp. NPDC127098]|uniref:ABC transporter ATP-binding protein n=1 Tax=Streptomyces sp. NPDC127098 TaxID=3347137 RepID=UPI003647F501